MFFHHSLKKTIQKALKKTVDEFSDCIPHFVDHFFYGAYDIGPQNLVIWFLFETDNDLKNARNSGLCDKITSTVITNLIAEGYPKEAFTSVKTDVNAEKMQFINATQEQIHSLIDALSNRCVHVSFTTKEDIDRKANGDYRLYFQ